MSGVTVGSLTAASGPPISYRQPFSTPGDSATNGSKIEEMGNGAEGMGEEKSLQIMVLDGSNSQIEMDKEERRKRGLREIEGFF